MSIDGRGSSPSRAAQDTISALKSERDRLKGQLAERTEERDRARRIAVALEQELAEVQAGVNRLERDANQRFAEEFGAAAGSARMTIADVQDLLSTVTGSDGDAE
jgi:chromosome segregation ATPase